MNTMSPLIWERVDHFIFRTPVPLGWLVKADYDVMTRRPDGSVSVSEWRPALTFVPDPQHLWGQEGSSEDLTDYLSQYADAQGVPATLEAVANMALGYGMSPDKVKDLMEAQVPGIS